MGRRISSKVTCISKAKATSTNPNPKKDTSSLVMTKMPGPCCTLFVPLPFAIRCSGGTALNWEAEILRSGIHGKRSDATHYIMECSMVNTLVYSLLK